MALSAAGRLIYQAGDDPEEQVREWLEKPALRELVELFGGRWPAGGAVFDRLMKLVDFSTVWDRRKGGTRLEMATMDHGDPRAAAAVDLIGELGLIGQARPAGGRYDWMLVLGGLAAGCRTRVEFAATLIREAAARPGAVCLLGSFRGLYPQEETAASEYAMGARSEVELLHAIADRTFACDEEWTIAIEGDPGREPRLSQLRGHRPGVPALRLYAAASSDPGCRHANTADTYRQFADDVALEEGAALLLVTTHLYAPFQHMDAVRVLGVPYGVTIETVGAATDGDLYGLGPGWYLQEIRSFLLSGLALLEATRQRR